MTSNLNTDRPRNPRVGMLAIIRKRRAVISEVYDVHEKNLGYDVVSLDLKSGDLRLIEVKGIGEAEGSIMLTPNELRVAQDRRDCYWLYVVTHCGTRPQLRDPIRDPARFPWHEVRKVAHYHLSISELTGGR